MFTKTQIDFMKNNGISIDFNKRLSDSDYVEIEEKISRVLQVEGFNKDYEPNQIGIICENIIDEINE